MTQFLKSLLWLSCLLIGPLWASATQPPLFTSFPTADISPAVVGQLVTFTTAATSPDNIPLTYLWAFGDGTTQGGPSVSHVYASAGIYYVYATVKDAQGGKAFNFIVEPVTAQSSAVLQCGFTKGNLKINLRKLHQDTLTISGSTSAAAAGVTPAGQTVTLNTAGQITTFAVNARGQGKSANGSTITFKVSKNGGPISFQISLQKQNFFLNFIKAGFNPNLQPFFPSKKKGAIQQIDVAISISWNGSSSALGPRANTGPTTAVGDQFWNLQPPPPWDNGLPLLPDMGDMDDIPLPPPPDLPDPFDPDFDLPDPYDDLPLPEPSPLPDPFEDPLPPPPSMGITGTISPNPVGGK